MSSVPNHTRLSIYSLIEYTTMPQLSGALVSSIVLKTIISSLSYGCLIRRTLSVSNSSYKFFPACEFINDTLVHNFSNSRQ